MPSVVGEMTKGAVFDYIVSGDSVDIQNITQQASPTGSTDLVLIWDAGLAANRAVLLDNLPFVGTGTGVSASSVLADNTLLRGDGGSRGIQDSGITVDDSNNMSGVGTYDGSGILTITDPFFGQGIRVSLDHLSTGPDIFLRRITDGGAVNGEDLLGTLKFEGAYDGTPGISTGADIRGVADQDWGPTIRGGRLSFFVTPSYGTSTQEVVRLTSEISAIHYLSIIGAASGGDIDIQATGGSNCGIDLISKGTGVIKADGLTVAPLTTKGDLLTFHTSDNQRLAVGATNGMKLVVDSAQTEGIKWKNDLVSGLCKIPFPNTDHEIEIAYFPEGVELDEIFSIIDTGTSVTWTLTQRPRGTPFSGGTTIQAGIVTNSTGVTTSSFTDATQDADDIMVVDITGVSGEPTEMLIVWHGHKTE